MQKPKIHSFTDLEKIHFHSIAQGSTTELQNQLFIARDVDYLENRKFTILFTQSVTVHKLINGLIKGARRILTSEKA